MKVKQVFGICRWLCLVLAVLLLGSAVTACRMDGNTPSDRETERGTQAGTETDAETGNSGSGLSTVLTIAENGASECKIYYETALSQYPDVMNRIYNMTDMIERYTGVSIRPTNDRFYDGSEEGLAILIGVTNYPATQAIVETMKFKDYHVGVSGNKLLLCGKSAESVCSAIDYFSNKIILMQGKTGKKLSVSSADNYTSHYQYALNSIQCLGTELKEYSIVMPQNATVNESLFAKNLRYYLYNEYGYDLGVTTDAESENKYEILVGKTARSTVIPGKNEYAVSAANGKLQLAADGMIGYDTLMDYCKATLLSSGSANDCVITEENATVDASEGLKPPTAYAMQKSGDARIFFFNIYGGTEYNLALREQMQIELFLSYDADILALQEMSVNTRKAAYRYPELLKEAGYTEVSAKTTGNNTPIFYRADRLEEVKSGYRLFGAEYNNGNSKSVTWAVFQIKETGKQFVVMSTHFCYFSGEEGIAGRTAHARELLDEIGKVREQYPNLPIIAGGDLNCTPSSAPVDVLRTAGMQCAWEIAEEKNNQQSHHAYPEYDSNYGIFTKWSRGSGSYASSIDQAWVFGNGMCVTTYAILTDYYALASSDHCPQLVDISLE